MGPPSEFEIGMRMKIGTEKCTIKWIGTLDGDAFERLGLEWDDVSRGKHNGEYNGKTYFKPLFDNSGSFVKKPVFGKSSTKIDIGIGLLQGLRERYLESDITEDAQVALELTPSVKIETRGWSKVQEKLSDPTRLKVASVSDTTVSWIDPGKEIYLIFPNLSELDLSRTLVSNWGALFGLVASLPSLQTLRLDGNRLSEYSGDFCNTAELINHLTNLTLNETYVSSKDLSLLAPLLQQLRTLQLRNTGLKNIPYPPLEQGTEWFPSLKKLDLSQNLINGEDSFGGLRCFPSLEHLDVSQNELSTFCPENSPPLSQSLKRLDLNYNLIDDWEMLAHIFRLFPALTHLHTIGNPIIKACGPNISRIKLISMIPGLTSLNSTPITSRERTDAELYYINQIVAPALKNSSEKTHHPQFARLCEQYGQPQSIARDNTNDSALVKNRLFLLNIILCISPPDASSPLTGLDIVRTSQKQFLKTATVRTLQMALPRLLGFPPTSKYQLYAIVSMEISSEADSSSKECSAQIVPLDNPVRPLQSFYLLKEGDSVCVVLS